jgi:putative salt-induced outer membrane protein YdiY
LKYIWNIHSRVSGVRQIMIANRFLLVLCLLLALPAHAYKPPKLPKPLPDGWDGAVTLGAQATAGGTRTSSLSGSAMLTYRGGRWENRFSTKLLRSTSTIVVNRTDIDGNVVTGSDGQPERIAVKGRTTDRRSVSFEPSWFFTGKSYVFSILDWETNEPGNIDIATRQIAGVGHKFWRSRYDFLAGEVGVGNKRLEQSTGEKTAGSIGYLGIKYVRQYTERVRFSAELDSDFGSENRFTELGLGFAYKVNSHFALRFSYTSRMNSDIRDPSNPLDSSVDSEATVSLEFDIL